MDSSDTDKLAQSYALMQTILTISIALNVFLTGALIYLYRTEDKRRKKREWRSFIEQMFKEGRARIRAAYACSVGLGQQRNEPPLTGTIIKAWFQAAEG